MVQQWLIASPDTPLLQARPDDCKHLVRVLPQSYLLAWAVGKAGKGAAHPIRWDRDPSSGVGGHPGGATLQGHTPFLPWHSTKCMCRGKPGEGRAGAAVTTRLGCSNELFQKYLSLVRDALFLEHQSITLTSSGVNVYL